MTKIISILDLGINNVQSVGRAVEHIGYEFQIVNEVDTLNEAEKIILPGIGSFDEGMKRLKSLGLLDVLHQKAKIEKVPILGICLGYQMMTKRSDEGLERGLGWFDCDTVKIRNDNSRYKVPHMGWNEVTWQKKSKIIDDIRLPSRFYFVHSYIPKTENKDMILATCSYGSALHVAFEQENLIGVQFHPEKSHIFGLKLIENFCNRY